MSYLYHYTKFESLKKIIKPDRILWLARYFRHFSNDDYEWVRNDAKPIIIEICEEKNWWFDPDFEMYKPYIISFCRSANSEYMWERFGANHEGIVIVIDEAVMKERATLLSTPPALLIPCEYINTKQEKEILKEKILKIANSEVLNSCQNDDRLMYASMGIMQNKLYQEQEIRYVTIEQKLVEVRYDNGVITVIPYEVPNEKYNKLIKFPKELLSGVILGKDTDQQDLDEASDYLIHCGYSPEIISKEQ